MQRHLTLDRPATGPAEPTGWAHIPWAAYAIEGALLAAFMVSACVFATLFEHPASPFRMAVDDPLLRRVPMGLAMGLTAIAAIYSPWGRRSGAHLNPATTLTFSRLGKVRAPDALGYVLAQLAGGVAGVQVAAVILGGGAGHPSVNYVATVPGDAGALVAFVAEAAISALLMLTVLVVSNTPRLARFTGLCAGLLVMTFIVVEAPLSGMSMNPARSVGSAVAARAWPDLWVYLTAPLVGMLGAAEVYASVRGRAGVGCAKLAHPTTGRCHFRCGYAEPRRETVGAAVSA